MSETKINWDYVAGWFDADGYVGKPPSHPCYRVQFGNTDLEVLKTIKDFIGVPQKISIKKTHYNRGVGKIYYQLVIADHANVKRIVSRLVSRCITKKLALDETLAWLKSREQNPNFNPTGPKRNDGLETKRQIREASKLRKQGLSYRGIGKKMNLSHVRIWRILNESSTNMLTN